METTLGTRARTYKRAGVVVAGAGLFALLMVPMASAGPVTDDRNAAQPCPADNRILKNEPELCSTRPVSFQDYGSVSQQAPAPSTGSSPSDYVWIGAVVAASAAAGIGTTLLRSRHGAHPIG